MKKIVICCLWAVLAGLVIAPLTGCEDRDTNDDISVTPKTSTLNGAGATVVLTVDDPDASLVRPLMWSVSNPSLGGILSAAGDSAVYESNGTRGQNSVKVIDQSDREGVVVVEQR